MKQNMGSLDRIVRIIGALVLLGISQINPVTGLVNIVTYILIALLLVTALAGYCPFYAILGMNTNMNRR